MIGIKTYEIGISLPSSFCRSENEVSRHRSRHCHTQYLRTVKLFRQTHVIVDTKILLKELIQHLDRVSLCPTYPIFVWSISGWVLNLAKLSVE